MYQEQVAERPRTNDITRNRTFKRYYRITISPSPGLKYTLRARTVRSGRLTSTRTSCRNSQPSKGRAGTRERSAAADRHRGTKQSLRTARPAERTTRSRSRSPVGNCVDHRLRLVHFVARLAPPAEAAAVETVGEQQQHLDPAELAQFLPAAGTKALSGLHVVEIPANRRLQDILV